jgi:hypothetical protein
MEAARDAAPVCATSVDSSFYRVAIRGDKTRGRVPQNGLKARRRFSTVSSTVRQFLAAKRRNSAQHSANA